MSDVAVNLLMQIPLAGVVVYVVWLFLGYMQTSNERMMQFLEQQEHNNQTFLREQREASNLAIARLAEEIKAVRQDVRRMEGVLLGRRGGSDG